MINLKYEFDDKPIREFLVAGKEFARKSIAVGVLGSDADKIHPTAKITVGEIAAIQEFGTDNGHIPSRPFLRSTLANKDLVLNTMARAARRVFSKKDTVEGALNKAGQVLSDAVRSTLLQGVPPPNAPATKHWKGHGDTLIGLTGALYDAITHKITGGR